MNVKLGGHGTTVINNIPKPKSGIRGKVAMESGSILSFFQNHDIPKAEENLKFIHLFFNHSLKHLYSFCNSGK